MQTHLVGEWQGQAWPPWSRDPPVPTGRALYTPPLWLICGKGHASIAPAGTSTLLPFGDWGLSSPGRPGEHAQTPTPLPLCLLTYFSLVIYEVIYIYVWGFGTFPCNYICVLTQPLGLCPLLIYDDINGFLTFWKS